jgi:hypothetical protein
MVMPTPFHTSCAASALHHPDAALATRSSVQRNFDLLSALDITESVPGNFLFVSL